MVGQNSRRSAGNTIAQDSMRLIKVEDGSEFLRYSIVRACGIIMNNGYCNLVKSGNIDFLIMAMTIQHMVINTRFVTHLECSFLHILDMLSTF